jgi:hypothetical protein
MGAITAITESDYDVCYVVKEKIYNVEKTR